MHYLVEHQTFLTKQELNETVNEHLKRNMYEMNNTDRDTLLAVSRFAVKFYGAAHLKAETLADLIGKSVKTARRAINKLVDLGIINKVETRRKVNGGKGANIFVILPLPSNDQSTMSSRVNAENLTESKAEAPEIAAEPFNSFKQKSNNKILDTSVPSNALKRAIPSEMYEAMSRFFDAEAMYKYYGILLRAKASVDPTVMLEDNAEPFVEAWNATILKVKQGKVRSICDYLFRAWQQATLTVKRQKSYDNLMLKICGE